MKAFIVTAAAAGLAVLITGCASTGVSLPAVNPAMRTGPLGAGGAGSQAPVVTRELVSKVAPQQMFVPGLPNFHKVNDNLYRGGKPEGEGVSQLKAMGVKTVIDLGFYFWEVDYLRDRDIRYVHIPFYTYHPTDQQVVEFFSVLADPSSGTVYVHCRLGADRTGFMMAVYRVAVCGWSREKAVDEMVHGGYGFNSEYQNLVNYVMTKDIPALGRQAGIRS